MKLPQLHLVVQDRAAEIPLHYLHGVLPMSMFAASRLMHPMGAGLQLKVEESLLVYMFAAFASLGSSWTLHVYKPQKLKSISPIFHIRRSKPCPFTCSHGRLRTDTDATHDAGAHAHAGNSLRWIFYVNLIGLQLLKVRLSLDSI